VKWLTKYGINKSRLSSEGWGQERPLATNNTDEGRRENRRVESHIVEGPGGEGGAK
jgi:outer membrane protein OmpA-like peptidoglycan-associated protein